MTFLKKSVNHWRFQRRELVIPVLLPLGYPVWSMQNIGRSQSMTVNIKGFYKMSFQLQTLSLISNESDQHVPWCLVCTKWFRIFFLCSWSYSHYLQLVGIAASSVVLCYSKVSSLNSVIILPSPWCKHATCWSPILLTSCWSNLVIEN